MPFTRISLKSLRRKAWEIEAATIGEHVLRRRLELGLSQKEAAAGLGVQAWTVLNWEKGYTAPPITAYKALIGFLGYEPCPPAKSLQERMRAIRRRRGWTIQEAARWLGVDPAAWGSWERSGRVPWKRYRQMLEDFLDREFAR